MNNEFQKLQRRIESLEKLVKDMQTMVHNNKDFNESRFKARREIINHEVQFLQKVYDKNGALVTEINT